MKSQILSKLTHPSSHPTSTHPHPDDYCLTPSNSHISQLPSHFQLRYQSVHFQPQPLQRKLQTALETAKQKTQQPHKPPSTNLFSFKKERPPKRSQRKENVYYVRPSPSQKARLKKFHSMVSLKSQESTKEEYIHCGSVASRLVLQQSHLQERGAIWGCGEDQKGRLLRIRRELNQIYQMGRHKVRLCLA